MVEIGYRIDAFLDGSFNKTFNAACSVINDLRLQKKNLDTNMASIKAYQNLQGAMNNTALKLNNARAKVKDLGLQMRSTNTPTDALKRQFATANIEAHKLQATLGNQRKNLSELRTELTNAGISTKNLESTQKSLETQSKNTAKTQAMLSDAYSKFNAIKQNLSLDNIRNKLVSSIQAFSVFQKPVQVSMDFEAAMARVNAVAFSGANNRTAEQKAANKKAFEALQEQARQLGRDTQFTAVEAANTQENLARAGFNANEIIAAMPGLLNTAAAEGMDLANAADIMASSLRGFGLEADQSSRVANVLAQASAASNLSIADLGESMKYVAPNAKTLGISIEEVSAMLGVFADAGIKGSQGGTALRAALLRLSKEPAAVAKALDKLGVKATDANGNMRDLEELMQVLSKRMQKMGTATRSKFMTDIFGTEASSAMMALMDASVNGEFSAKKFEQYSATGELQAVVDYANKSSKGLNLTFETMQAAMLDTISSSQALGISFKDLSIYTAILVKSGVSAEKINKSVSTAFTRLASSPKQVQQALKKLNKDFSLYTADGAMKEFPVLLNEIWRSIEKLPQTQRLNILENIFGKGTGESIQALMKNAGEEAVKGYNEAAKSAKGVAAEMAEKNLATLRGQWEIAKSAMSDFMIEIGNKLLPKVTKIVEAFTSIISSITTIMREYPKVTTLVVQSLGLIATYKVTATIGGIVKAVGSLANSWLAVHNATQTAVSVAGTLAPAISGSLASSGGKISYLKDLIMTLTGPLGIVAAAVALIALNWEDVCKWCERAGEAMKQAKPRPISEVKRSDDDYDIQQMMSIYQIPSLAPEQHALGGIFSTPHIGLVAEAGREAIIPLQNKTRGIPLLNQAARELGVFSKLGGDSQNKTSVINKFSPVLPDIKLPEIPKLNFDFSLPELLPLQEKTFENNIPAVKSLGIADKFYGYKEKAANIINNFMPKIGLSPIEDKINVVPLWKAADTKQDILAPQNTNNTTNNSSENNSRVFNLSPSFNFTISGISGSGDNIGLEERLRAIVENCLAKMQNDLERLSFA